MRVWMAMAMTSAALGLAITSPAMAQKADRHTAPAPAQIDEALIQEIGRLLQSGDWSLALSRLDRLVDRADFKTYPQEFQHAMHAVRVELAQELGRHSQALAYARRATAVEGAGVDQWRMRYFAAWRAGDDADAGQSLITLVGYGAGALDGVDAQTMRGFVLAGVLQAPEGRTLQTRIIDALFDAGWDEEASGLWLIGATRALDRGDAARAVRFAAKIEGPSERIVMATDHRFANLRDDEPSLVDVTSALERQLLEVRRKAEADPSDVDAATVYALRLMLRGRLDQALSVINTTIQQAEAGDEKSGVRTTETDDFIWALDTRSRILVRLGRHDEAVVDLRRAARRPEGGGMNISHAINLGSLYVSIDRPEQALEAVIDIEQGNASPFGLMQAALVRACAQAALGRAADLKATMAWMEAHASDAPEAFGAAAACNNQESRAAADLIARLDDPDRRGAALLSVQDYLDTPVQTESDRRESAFWDRVHARDDVKAAIDRAGVVRAWAVLTAAY